MALFTPKTQISRERLLTYKCVFFLSSHSSLIFIFSKFSKKFFRKKKFVFVYTFLVKNCARYFFFNIFFSGFRELSSKMVECPRGNLLIRKEHDFLRSVIYYYYLTIYIFIFYLTFFRQKVLRLFLTFFFSLIFFTNNFLRLFKKYAILCM